MGFCYLHWPVYILRTRLPTRRVLWPVRSYLTCCYGYLLAFCWCWVLMDGLFCWEHSDGSIPPNLSLLAEWCWQDGIGEMKVYFAHFLIHLLLPVSITAMNKNTFGRRLTAFWSLISVMQNYKCNWQNLCEWICGTNQFSPGPCGIRYCSVETWNIFSPVRNVFLFLFFFSSINGVGKVNHGAAAIFSILSTPVRS